MVDGNDDNAERGDGHHENSTAAIQLGEDIWGEVQASGDSLQKSSFGKDYLLAGGKNMVNGQQRDEPNGGILENGASKPGKLRCAKEQPKVCET